MLVGFLCRNTASCRPVDKADLDQVRLIDILQRHSFFADRIGQSLQPDRTAMEPINDAMEIPKINFIKPQRIHMETIKRLGGNFLRNPAAAEYLGKVADPPQQTIGNPRRTAGTPRNFNNRIRIDFRIHHPCLAGHNPGQLLDRIIIKF